MRYLEPAECSPGMQVLLLETERNGVNIAPFKSSRFSVIPGYSSAVDVHAVAEIWIVMRGTGDLRHGGRSIRLRPDDVVHFQPFESHQVHNDGNETFTALSLWW